MSKKENKAKEMEALIHTYKNIFKTEQLSSFVYFHRLQTPVMCQLWTQMKP